LFYNFNTGTATHAYGGLINQNLDVFFDMVPQPPALNGSKKHLLGWRIVIPMPEAFNCVENSSSEWMALYAN
jgi:hypothetical protein